MAASGNFDPDEYAKYMDATDARIDAFLDYIHFETLIFCLKTTLILYLVYYMLKKGLLLKKTCEATLANIGQTAYFYGFLITLFIFFTLPEYSSSLDNWLTFLGTLLVCSIGFFIGWKSSSGLSVKIKNSWHSLIHIPGNAYYFYSHQALWFLLLFRIYIVYYFLPTMKIPCIYPIIYLVIFLAGMFIARFFYAFILVQQKNNL